MGLKDKGDVFDVQCTNPLNVFPIQDTHAIGSDINLDKGRRAWSATKKVEYIWNDLRSTKAQKSV